MKIGVDKFYHFDKILIMKNNLLTKEGNQMKFKALNSCPELMEKYRQAGLPIRYRQITRPHIEIRDKFLSGYQQINDHNIPGMVGFSGKKVHSLWVTYIEIDNTKYLLSVYSTCGSQKWNGSLSQLRIVDDAGISCIKCQKELERKKRWAIAKARMGLGSAKRARLERMGAKR